MIVYKFVRKYAYKNKRKYIFIYLEFIHVWNKENSFVQK